MDVRRRMKVKLDELNFDFQQFTLDRFIHHVEAHIQREILLIPWQMSPGLFGAWISDADEPYEFIFFDKAAPPLHQVHIKLHELAHVLCGHKTLQIKSEQIAQIVSGDVTDTAVFSSARQRSPETEEAEEEAEVLAALIQLRVIQHKRQEELATTISADNRVNQYIRQMGMA